MKNFKIEKNNTAVIAIDFQERLMPAMRDEEELCASVVKMVKGARVMNVPILVTQQYTRGLGDTIEPIKEALGEFSPIEKTSFSAFGAEEFVAELEKTGAKTVILFGIEAHICVQQTALDLIERGYDVFVATDCCSSRKKHDKKTAFQRMAQSGAVLTTVEAVLFEFVGGAKEEGFKQISAIIK
ncbi:MAG: hydrolase [Anaerovoracaceae bacterium]